ncbi:HAMP domain-containing histidine kinase [Luteolibacter yonseiensis]|uniref:histidine kinase n=1 Tax=Luteolibacter yonseiensis TaxID=1144680 RepID=A0A934R1W2_9BACT|nr:HAMP domain-containing sensor histidine kinase [Luteolibacter yonseiensis]MBK1814922.1 HAMP domain-containing histidine kinase [Luteolibacter yonseiensis]
MKIARGICIWVPLALCGVIMLGAMTWLTRGVLASEKERVLAEARADLEERTRLALWRMDALGSAVLLRESQLPPVDFHMSGKEVEDSAVHLRFEVRSGRLASSEMDETTEKFQFLRRLLSRNGDIDALLNCASEVSEQAWRSLPKDAMELQSKLAETNKANPASKRASAVYQSDSNKIEQVQRTKVLESQVAFSQLSNTNLITNAAPVTGFGEILEIGGMRPVWIGEELLLLRHVTVRMAEEISPVIQGVWLDAGKVNGLLLKEAADLLPTATLEKLVFRVDDPLGLASFPYRLQRNPVIPPEAPPWSPALVIGWIAVLFALFTVSLLIHGVMRLSERRASFVSAVTHELRTPLTTFRLYSDMLESGAVRPEKRGEYLRVLSREADRLAHLVENVLSFSKIERGSARSSVREIVVDEFLESVRDRLEARLATAEMRLEMRIPCKIRLQVDAAAVEHIIFNLIDNAAKYAAGGDPPVVEIRTATSVRHLEIVVTDSGPGIPVSERRRIFRAFHKSAREAAESRPGVGLGLALSRRLAKSLGGGLDCVDAEQGARFVLRLPLVG